MSAPFARALRVLAPTDLRLIWRDGFLLLIMLVLPISGLAFHWLLPFLDGALSEWVDLETYYGLILGFFLVAQQPIMLGAVIGILFVEERDQGTLLALRASPLSLQRFLGYRVAAGIVLSTLLGMLAVALANLVPIPFPALLASSLLASLTVPLVALLYAVYIRNKVQAVTALKPLQSWALLPALLFFVPTPWQWIGSIPAPLYYPIRLFASAVEGQPEWWTILPGIALQVAAALWLWRRFARTVH